MRLVVFTEPQLGATHADLLRVALLAEELGFDAFFRSDHYLTMPGLDGLPGPSDAWATMAALAVQTSTIRLGTLVTPVTFRLPGPLAITVAQVDQMSGGRIELGMGAGWYEAEHSAYGIPFPSRAERFDMLSEQLAIVTGLWRTPVNEKFSYDGKHYKLSDSPALPKPVQQPGPWLIIGGHGPKRTPQLTALYADEYNLAFCSMETIQASYERAAAACERYGRAESGKAPLVLSVAMTVTCGRTEAQAQARVERVGWKPPLYGTPDQVVDVIGQYAKLGATRLFLQIVDLHDLDHLELIASEVMPQVA